MMSTGQGLAIEPGALEAVNRLLDDDSPLVRNLRAVVVKYGTPAEINARAERARALPTLLERLDQLGSPYLADVHWLDQQRASGAFVPLAEFEQQVLGEPANYRTEAPVTLEISALQYFPWLIDEARAAIAARNLLPGRFIRVRNMKEAAQDQGDLLAVAAGMQIVGASYVETLDTRGTDGSNIHLGGPATLAGYLGGVGQPNDYPLKWADEFLHYFTEYGIQQVLNTNPGTMLVGFLLHRLGVDIELKISVLMGTDNPFSVLLTLLCARLFARPDGSTPLIGLNFSNSADNTTVALAAQLRRELGFEQRIRFEIHVNQAYKGIVRQPFCRRDELVELAATVPNISAKHEGGELAVEQASDFPSDLLDYFRAKADIEAAGQMTLMRRGYLERHDSLNLTAAGLIRGGIPVAPAANLH